MSLLKALDTSLFKTQILGRSVEGREIYEVQVGTGEIEILLWSQMHGNEPTATAVLISIWLSVQTLFAQVGIFFGEATLKWTIDTNSVEFSQARISILWHRNGDHWSMIHGHF